MDAIDADSKLIATWMIGSRDAEAAYEFMQDLAGRLRNRVQLTDSHRPYLQAAEAAFGSELDYAILQKIYGVNCTVADLLLTEDAVLVSAEDIRRAREGIAVLGSVLAPRRMAWRTCQTHT